MQVAEAVPGKSGEHRDKRTMNGHRLPI
jgi:hypothetical protein